jgi:hypothetical protein
VKLAIVGLALLAAVAARVVAEVKLPPPAVAGVGGRTMRRETAEDRDVAGRKVERYAARFVDRRKRQRVVIAVAR